MIIGIDPGNTGAIAFMTPAGHLVEVVDMPLMANGKKQQINGAQLKKIIDCYPVEAAVVEKVGAMPGQGVSSMFNFGMGFGVILGVLAGAGIPATMATPQAWKKAAGLIGKDKDMARTLAQQLYPEAQLGRKKDIGRADAILIARFGQKEGQP